MKKNKKNKNIKNRVYIECSDTVRKVKGIILHKDEKSMQVEMPTGFVLKMQKKTRRGYYAFRFGLLEFLSDGREIS